jgi:heme a synthase
MHINTIDWRTATRRLSVVTAAGIVLVYMMGLVVTNTGSGQGCGDTWPLCRGKLVPEFAFTTAVEFSHRSVTGIESILILALAVGALVYWRNRREIQVLVPVMVFMLFAEAGLGALIISYPKNPAIIALHFGSSQILVTSVMLTSVVLNEAATGADALRDRPVPRRFAWLVVALILFTYLVGYVGAYLSHMGIGLACPDWPLCHGTVVPRGTGATAAAQGMVLLHRYAAAVLVLATVGLVLWARRSRRGRPDLYRGSLFALAIVLLQALAGAVVVFSQLNLFSTLAHGALVALYFVALGYLFLHVLPRPAAFRTKVVRVPARAAGALPAVSTGPEAPVKTAPTVPGS